jgi:hypothetical protein
MTTIPGKRVAVYLRVSTSEQTTTNQRRELHAVSTASTAGTRACNGASGGYSRSIRPIFPLRFCGASGAGVALPPSLRCGVFSAPIASSSHFRLWTSLAPLSG